MEIYEFRNEIIKETLKDLDRPPQQWSVFNDILHTKIGEDIPPISRVILQDNELPILECALKKSYLLITTSRVVSIVDSKYDEISLEQINDEYVDREYYNKIFDGKVSKYPKTGKLIIQKKDGTNLLTIIDSYYPLAFARNLISIIIFYVRYRNSHTLPPTSK